MKPTPKTSFILYRITSTDEEGGSYVPRLPVAGEAPVTIKERPGHPFGLGGAVVVGEAEKGLEPA